MSQINVGGVLKGGLAAGLIMNISEFVLNVPVAGAQMNAELAARNLPPVAGGQIAVFVVLTFVLGLADGLALRGDPPALRRRARRRRSSPASDRVGAAPTSTSRSRSASSASTRWARRAQPSSGPLIEMIVASSVGGYLYKESSDPGTVGTRRPT